MTAVTPHTLTELQEQAERMFAAVTALRLSDAIRRGTNSDVYYGQLHALKHLGLIAADRVDAHEARVRTEISAYYAGRVRDQIQRAQS